MADEQSQSEDTKLITLAQGAKRAKKHPGTLRYAARQGHLKTLRIGEKLLVTTNEWVDEWLSVPEYHTTGPNPKG